MHCLVVGGFLGETTPQETRSWTCEFGESELARDNPVLPAAIGDWRPPKAYSYNLRTKQLPDRTPTTGPAALLFRTTPGLRSAGSRGGVVFLAGPALSAPGGINFFAFSAATGALVDAAPHRRSVTSGSGSSSAHSSTPASVRRAAAAC